MRPRSTARSRRPTSASPTRSSRATASWTCRCGVVWGTEDTWIPVDRAHRLTAAVPGAELHLVPGAGHLIQLDAPEALTALVLGALSRTP
ncbi:alpha/beta fold hydrolase [Pseudonocardia alni]|uniref:alpha/beta fold hydrolase n=1 Tax=Pseudonocardia alni TaxID=33907 RepID=UPI00340C1B28